MDFNQTGSTNLTVGWMQERWGIHLSEETIDYKVQVFERNFSVPVREVTRVFNFNRLQTFKHFRMNRDA